jgi:hypothetical protein
LTGIWLDLVYPDLFKVRPELQNRFRINNGNQKRGRMPFEKSSGKVFAELVRTANERSFICARSMKFPRRLRSATKQRTETHGSTPTILSQLSSFESCRWRVLRLKAVAKANGK